MSDHDSKSNGNETVYVPADRGVVGTQVTVQTPGGGSVTGINGANGEVYIGDKKYS